MSALWTSGTALAAVGGSLSGSAWEASGVSIDTRTLEPGDLFVALRDTRDGHDFVAEAFRKGAAAALISRVPEGVARNASLLVCHDVQTGLERLAAAARSRTVAKVIAVTGSAGKTSTKEMLRHVLGRQGRTHASEASFNNHWGVPLTLARMPPESEFAVIEIGMNHPGEIAPLAQLARPHVAIVTTVAAAHLEVPFFRVLNRAVLHSSTRMWRRHRSWKRRQGSTRPAGSGSERARKPCCEPSA